MNKEQIKEGLNMIREGLKNKTMEDRVNEAMDKIKANPTMPREELLNLLDEARKPEPTMADTLKESWDEVVNSQPVQKGKELADDIKAAFVKAFS